MSCSLAVRLLLFSSKKYSTERLSYFVDYHLQPSVDKLPSFVKDTNDFLNKLLTIGNFSANSLLVTLDVSSLYYTNIPHNEGINACERFLRTSSHKTIPTSTLCDVIRMILTMNNFSFNDNNYLQIHGTAMGTKMAPSYANLFLGFFEANALKNAPFQPHTWLRYIDDIFMIWTEGLDNLKIFIDYLNNIHSTIKFTSSHSFTNVPFLDVNVSLTNDGNISTDLYTKPTDKHQHLLYSSCHPLHTKKDCATCPYISHGLTTYTFFSTGETCSIKFNLTCETKNLIYMIQCNRCNLQYIGETKRRLKDRFNEHRRTIDNPNNKSKPTTAAEHFLSSPNHTANDMILIPIEKIFSNRDFIRKAREAFFNSKRQNN